MVKLLASNGADVHFSQKRRKGLFRKYYVSPIDKAIYHDNLAMVNVLIDHGVPRDQTIIKAVKAQNLTLVKFLAENGADVNAIGYFKKNVMDYAQKEGNEEIISYLRSQGAMTKEERNEQYKATMKLESDIKAALIAEDFQSIISLMSQHDVIILQEKVVQNTAYVSAKKGNIQMMNKLLSDDVDLDINSPVNATGQSSLFVAAIYGQNELILDLLAKGANIDQMDKNGKTASDFITKKSTKKLFKKWKKNNWEFNLSN